jgi:hypothetical protein
LCSIGPGEATGPAAQHAEQAEADRDHAQRVQVDRPAACLPAHGVSVGDAHPGFPSLVRPVNVNDKHVRLPAERGEAGLTEVSAMPPGLIPAALRGSSGRERTLTVRPAGASTAASPSGCTHST